MRRFLDTAIRWLRTAACVLPAAALLLWAGDARAACDSDVAEAMHLESDWFAPASSGPCCLGRVPVLATDKPRAGSAPLPAACAPRAVPHRDPGSASRGLPALDQRPARPYCERSSRLLR
jgi:hypothetical protein